MDSMDGMDSPIEFTGGLSDLTEEDLRQLDKYCSVPDLTDEDFRAGRDACAAMRLRPICKNLGLPPGFERRLLDALKRAGCADSETDFNGMVLSLLVHLSEEISQLKSRSDKKPIVRKPVRKRRLRALYEKKPRFFAKGSYLG